MSEARVQRGTLMASGFIAGGAIMGVVGALLVLAGWPATSTWASARRTTPRPGHQPRCFTGLCLFLYFDSRRAKPVEHKE